MKTADYYEFQFSREYGKIGIVEEASNFLLQSSHALAAKVLRQQSCQCRLYVPGVDIQRYFPVQTRT